MQRVPRPGAETQSAQKLHGPRHTDRGTPEETPTNRKKHQPFLLKCLKRAQPFRHALTSPCVMRGDGSLQL